MHHMRIESQDLGVTCLTHRLTMPEYFPMPDMQDVQHVTLRDPNIDKARLYETFPGFEQTAIYLAIHAQVMTVCCLTPKVLHSIFKLSMTQGLHDTHHMLYRRSCYRCAA